MSSKITKCSCLARQRLMMCVLSCWLLIKWHCILDWLWLSDANSSVPAGVFLTRDCHFSLYVIMISHQLSLLITSCYCPMKSHSHSLPFSSLCSLSINACHICSTADQLPVWCTARNQQKECKLLHKGCHVLLPMQLAVCMLIVLGLTVNQSLQCCVQMPRQSVCV